MFFLTCITYKLSCLFILPFIDRYVIEYLGTTSKQAKHPKPITFLAVYDGHGGAEASQFCSDWLSSYIRKDKEYPINISNAMKSAFATIDKDFVASGYLDGSTACACAVIGDEAGYEKIICANAGDSRAIVVKKNGSFVALSDDHKPDRNDETKRINDLGGKVIHWGRWRVEGVLAVSRSVGDARLKPYVTAVCSWSSPPTEFGIQCLATWLPSSLL